MIRLQFRITWILVLALVAAATAQAQLITGMPPFGSFSGGPDIVNNANLNVHLAIPVVSKGGRGMQFNYVFNYDSSVWLNSGMWYPASKWGWKGITEVETGYVSYNTTVRSCFSAIEFKWYYWNDYANWVYHDPQGMSHTFNGSTVTNFTGAPCGSETSRPIPESR